MGAVGGLLIVNPKAEILPTDAIVPSFARQHKGSLGVHVEGALAATIRQLEARQAGLVGRDTAQILAVGIQDCQSQVPDRCAGGQVGGPDQYFVKGGFESQVDLADDQGVAGLAIALQTWSPHLDPIDARGEPTAPRSDQIYGCGLILILGETAQG